MSSFLHTGSVSYNHVLVPPHRKRLLASCSSLYGWAITRPLTLHLHFYASWVPRRTASQTLNQSEPTIGSLPPTSRSWRGCIRGRSLRITTPLLMWSFATIHSAWITQSILWGVRPIHFCWRASGWVVGLGVLAGGQAGEWLGWECLVYVCVKCWLC